MITTPIYSENPKGFLRAENFDAEDGIPLEKGSGFGNHLMRDVLTSSIVLHYIEVTATTTVDVSARYSDLHLRIVGAGEGIIVTVAGSLPQGRRLHVDVQAAENASSIVVGGVTYELPAGGGVLTFVSTSDGWSAPLNLEFDLRIANELTVDGAARFNGGIVPKARTYANIVWEKVTIGPLNAWAYVPSGFHLIRLMGGGSPRIEVHLQYEGVNSWIVMGGDVNAVVVVPSDGANYRMINTHSSESATFYILKI